MTVTARLPLGQIDVYHNCFRASLYQRGIRAFTDPINRSLSLEVENINS